MLLLSLTASWHDAAWQSQLSLLPDPLAQMQVASYVPPSALPPYRLVLLLYRCECVVRFGAVQHNCHSNQLTVRPDTACRAPLPSADALQAAGRRPAGCAGGWSGCGATQAQRGSSSNSQPAAAGRTCSI